MDRVGSGGGARGEEREVVSEAVALGLDGRKPLQRRARRRVLRTRKGVVLAQQRRRREPVPRVSCRAARAARRFGVRRRVGRVAPPHARARARAARGGGLGEAGARLERRGLVGPRGALALERIGRLKHRAPLEGLEVAELGAAPRGELALDLDLRCRVLLRLARLRHIVARHPQLRAQPRRLPLQGRRARRRRRALVLQRAEAVGRDPLAVARGARLGLRRLAAPAERRLELLPHERLVSVRRLQRLDLPQQRARRLWDKTRLRKQGGGGDLQLCERLARAELQDLNQARSRRLALKSRSVLLVLCVVQQGRRSLKAAQSQSLRAARSGRAAEPAARRLRGPARAPPPPGT